MKKHCPARKAAALLLAAFVTVPLAACQNDGDTDDSGSGSTSATGNYVTIEMRIQLRNSTKSIKEIAEEMNFANQSFLGKYFKEHVGISPSEYRKNKS